MENYELTPASKPAPVVLGPRTHGVDDKHWEDEARKFRGQATRVTETRAETDAPVSALTMALAAWTDPALPFRTNSEDIARTWTQETLKRAYQAVRVPHKRPWPEFAASLRAGFGFTPADAAAVALAAHVDIASVEAGGLVVAPRSLDADFASTVLDVQEAAASALGTVCERAVCESTARGRTSPRDLARALSIATNGLSMRALEATVAAREAALQSWARGRNA